MGKKSKGKGRDKLARKERKRAQRLAVEAVLPADAVHPAEAPLPVEPISSAEVDGSPSRPAPRPAADATELAARLANLSTILGRHLSRADAGVGLTRARLSALALLVLGGPRTLGELAAAEHVRPPTMTRLVHAMEADGLVARERNPADGRSVVIGATPAGMEQLELGRARQIAPLARSIAELDGADRRQLEDAADLLGRVLRDSAWEPAPSDG